MPILSLDMHEAFSSASAMYDEPVEQWQPLSQLSPLHHLSDEGSRSTVKSCKKLQIITGYCFFVNSIFYEPIIILTVKYKNFQPIFVKPPATRKRFFSAKPAKTLDIQMT